MTDEPDRQDRAADPDPTEHAVVAVGNRAVEHLHHAGRQHEDRDLEGPRRRGPRDEFLDRAARKTGLHEIPVAEEHRVAHAAEEHRADEQPGDCEQVGTAGELRAATRSPIAPAIGRDQVEDGRELRARAAPVVSSGSSRPIIAETRARRAARTSSRPCTPAARRPIETASAESGDRRRVRPRRGGDATSAGMVARRRRSRTAPAAIDANTMRISHPYPRLTSCLRVVTQPKNKPPVAHCNRNVAASSFTQRSRYRAVLR